MRKANVRRRRNTRRISGIESLETRVLLAGDMYAVGITGEHVVAHGPGCGCPACGGLASCGGDISTVLPEGHAVGDVHDDGAESLRYDAFGNAYYFDPAPDLGAPTDDGDGGGSDGGGGESLTESADLAQQSGCSQKGVLRF